MVEIGPTSFSRNCFNSVIRNKSYKFKESNTLLMENKGSSFVIISKKVFKY